MKNTKEQLRLAAEFEAHRPLSHTPPVKDWRTLQMLWDRSLEKGSVINMRLCPNPFADDCVYIGRPKAGSAWRFGNPFVVGRDGVRGQCIEKYRQWLLRGKTFGCRDATPARRLWILKNVGALFDRRLVCWCAPAPCHGDVLVWLCKRPGLVQAIMENL